MEEPQEETMTALEPPEGLNPETPPDAAVTTFQDHFTLQIPTSTVRYRHQQAAARIIETSDAQYILEEHKDKVEIRRVHDTSEGVRFLRVLYALVTAFWTGFLFVFCIQVILYAILDLTIQSGATSRGDTHYFNAVGVFLALPGLVDGCASAMVMAGSYIQDTVQGHTLIRNFAFRSFSPVVLEWIFFCVFLGMPILVLCGCLLSQSDNWFSITLLFWFSCILTFFAFFALSVVWFEIQACYEVLRNRYNDHDGDFFHVFARCIHLRQTARFGGIKTIRYVSLGTISDSDDTDRDDSRANAISSTYQERFSCLAKLTLKFVRWGWFEDLTGREQRVYSIDAVRDVRPYATTHTWNLDKFFCRRANTRYITIVRGPGALTPSQLRSSIVCSLIGSCLIVCITFSFLVYLGLGVFFSLLMTVLGAFLFMPSFRSTWGIYKLVKSLHLFGDSFDDEQEKLADSSHSTAMYLVEEIYRISQPTKNFIWVTAVIDFTILFLYPFASLLVINNGHLALLFFLLCGVSWIRDYFNAAVVLEEAGHMDLVDAQCDVDRWKSKSRLNEIIGNITRGRSRWAWISILGSLCFTLVAISISAVYTETDDVGTFDTPFTYSYDYKYELDFDQMYPLCQVPDVMGIGQLNTIADFAFMAGLAYRGRGDITTRELEAWFKGQAIDEDEIVQDYRSGIESAVSFKLISFPNADDLSVILIRGTTSTWDILTDAQLWMPAVLMQFLREVLPFGSMWNPVIDELIKLISLVESSTIRRVSFYKDTTRFVKWLEEKYPDRLLIVTGHSLGGGLSIITGAQAGIPAVALSGTNAMLSRKSFDPPISRRDLDIFTFNIIPRRDIVPLVDDPAQNFQIIRCEAGLTDIPGCHDPTRSLCEIIYSCGSGNRPVLCECVTEYGYPEPVPVDGNITTSFTKFCTGRV